MQGQFHTHKYIGVMRQFQAGVEPQTTQRAIPLPAEAGSPLARLSVASDRGGITPPQEVVLRAAARTHHRTGIPISTHTWSPDRVGEQQVRMLEEEGAPLHRVYIGHNNDDTDLGYLLGLLHKSVWLGMDRYPRRTGAWHPGLGATHRPGQAIDGCWVHSSPHAVARLLGPQSPLRCRRPGRATRANPDGYNFI